MIKNIVFDLGNVLISFKPSDYLDKTGYPEEAKRIILNDVFSSREWWLIDNGDLSTGEAIEKIASRSAMKKEEIASVFDLRTEILFPLAGNIILLPELKKQGFKLYYLSNFPDDIFDEVVNRYDFFKYFDGGIISSRVKTSKPDKKIFEILLGKFSLNAEECLFIDDIEINANAASSTGMKGLFFNDPDNLKGLIEAEILRVSQE
jgi:HAD superfamily hydrolase (TIGR01509 family)